MINPIVPHGPPVQPDPSGVPVSTRDKSGSSPSFDDFLSDQPTKETPPPIEDHSPPSVLPETAPTEAPTLDPIRGMMPRPIRWKESKTPAPGTTPRTGVLRPDVPLPPIDPQLVATSITLSPSWSPVAPPTQESEAAATETSSAQSTTLTQVSSSDAAGTNAVFTPDALPVQTLASGMMRRMQPDNMTVSSAPVPTNTQAPPTVVARQAAPAGGTPTAPPDLTLPLGLLNTGRAVPVPAAAELSASPVAAVSNVGDLGQPLPASPSTNVAASILTTGTALNPEETNLPLPVGPDLSALPPTTSHEADEDPVSALSTNQGSPTTLPPTDLRAVITGPVVPSPTFRNQPSTTPLADSLSVSVDPVAPQPPGTDFSVTAPVADPRVATPVVPTVPVEPTPPPVAMASGATVTFSASGTQAELSTPSVGEQAKIAGLPTPEIKSARKLETAKSQVTGNERITSLNKSDGTPVAKDQPVVNAAISTDEKETEASPLSKRGEATVLGAPVSNQAANGHSQGAEILVGAPVSGPATVDRTATPVTQTVAPDPTAARQAVKVEALLQHTLSAGESVRPNGSDQMEMRVRLDGGHEDVTVRMQVVNNRMQVTFQTNSPELRKALEHGWEQFSTDASRLSTLSMSEPRFETPGIPSAPPTGQADAQSFSSNQQNSRRQETPAAFADEPVASVDPRRSGFATAATVAPAPGQSAARRWSGWA